MPKFELMPETSKNPFKRLAESKLARTGAVALGLHAAALSPQALEAIKRAREAASEFERSWFQENTVIHPQSEDEQKVVREKSKKRESRIDAHAREVTKQTYREKLEHGVRVSLRDLYFDMEAANGVDPELVAKAERKADSLILKYSQEANGELSDPLIRRIVTEMYGSDEAYDWGQGSVSEYFVDGSRNCNAIAKGELIVFEGVIDRLPEDSRKRYELGLRIIEQHQQATLGTREQTYLLEIPIVIEGQDADLSGTVNIGLDLLKKGIVSEKPISVNAVSGENVRSGPKIDIATDQPVDDGIIPEGGLRWSDYVKRIAEERGIVPQQERLKKEDVVEIEILSKGMTKEEAFGEVYRQRTLPAEPFTYGYIKSPAPETVEAVNAMLSEPKNLEFFEHTGRVGALRQWSPGAVAELMNSPLGTIEIHPTYLKKKGKFDGPEFESSIKKILFAMESVHSEGKVLRFHTIVLEGRAARVDDEVHPDSALLERFLRAAHGVESVELRWNKIDGSELAPIINADLKRIDLSSVNEIPSSQEDTSVPWRLDFVGGLRLIQELHKAKAEIVINEQWYWAQLQSTPEIAEYKNILPDLKYTTEEWLTKSLDKRGVNDSPSERRLRNVITDELQRRNRKRLEFEHQEKK